MSVRLVCPFCREVIVDGDEPKPGRCGGCGSRYGGGADTPPDAVAAAMAAWGVDAPDSRALARRLFDLDPATAATPATVASDERDGFYRWWMFIRNHVEPERLRDEVP